MAGIAQSVDFTFQSSSGTFCSPATISFQQQASGNPTGFVWNFGGGISSNSPNPVVTLPAGIHNVQLIAIYANTTASVTKQVEIHPAISATLNADRNYICTPGSVNFTASTTGNNVQWQWDFGDTSGIVSGSSNMETHNYNRFGNFNATVTATDGFGCTAGAVTTIKVTPPPISGTVSPRRGCIPANVTLQTNVNLPIGGTVTNYVWDFGDGTPPVTNTSPALSHSYTAVGGYAPSVSITSNEGCTASFNFPGLAFGTPPYNTTAYATQPRYCGSDQAVFIAHAVNANSYHWDFGDGTSANTSDTLIRHLFDTLGIKNVTVTPNFNGCVGPSQSLSVEIVGVIARYNFANTCNQKNVFRFDDASYGNVTRYTWHFGDGINVDSTPVIYHTYPTSGIFKSGLTVYDSITGCSDADYRYLYTATPSMVNPDSAVCRNASTTFKVDNSYKNTGATYEWHVVGTIIGPNRDSVLTMNPDSFGLFQNYVVINNGTGHCRDTQYLPHTVLVKGPVLDFSLDQDICRGEWPNIQNSSYPFISSDSVVLWEWTYSHLKERDTIYQPEPMRFDRGGNLTVQLLARDVYGCTDSLEKPLVVHNLPFLEVITTLNDICAGTQDTLIAFHNDPITWSASAPLPCTSCDTLITYPTQPATYFVTATNATTGCSILDSVSLNVYPVFQATTVTPGFYICPGETVQLDVSPKNTVVTWSPPSGLSALNVFQPYATPAQSTNYLATLVDSAGCFSDTLGIPVNVYPPALVDAGPDLTLPYYTPFTLQPQYSPNIISYNWVPAQDLSCYSCPDPSGRALDNISYLIEVSSENGCRATDSINIFIECNAANLLLPNAFTPNNDLLNDVIYPIGRGIRLVSRFSIYDRAGDIVFEKSNFLPNDPSFGWDGRISGEPASTDVFVYILIGECGKGEKLTRKGVITLIR